MSFIRTKNIKGNEYAYLIKNRWLKTRKQSKQKVIGYLGRVIKPVLKEGMKDISFFDFYNIYEPEDYLEESGKEKIVEDLLGYELARHDSNGYKINFDYGDCSLTNEKRKVVVKINDGFMCSHTIKALKDFSAQGEEEEVGLELAKAFVNAGIDVPKDIFIGYFLKCMD